MLVGHGSTNDTFCYAMPGAKVRKMHSSRRDAFKVINSKPFAKIFLNTIEILKEHKIRNKEKVKLDLKYEEKVALLKFYPGQNPKILDYYLKNKYKGIVIEMTGLGHVSESWIKKIKELINKGIVICGVSQCINGRVDGLVYSTGRALMKTGVIYLEDMLAETAFVKLGWVLGHEEWNVREKMLENISGELNERLEE